MKGSKYYGPEPVKLSTFDNLDSITGSISDVKVKDFPDGSKLAITIDDTWSLVLNGTSYRVICNVYGDETNNWLGRELTVFKGRLRFNNREQDGLCVRVPPVSDENEAAAAERRATLKKPTNIAADDPLDSDIPF
jgi:hypothetical protein